MDLNQLLQSMVAVGSAREAANTQTVQQLEGIQAQEAQAAQREVSSLQQALALGQQAGAAKAALDYQIGKANEATAAIFGMNPNDPSYAPARYLAEAEAAEAQRKSARTKFDQLSSYTLLNNPVGFLLAQLELPGLAAQNNAAVDARDNAYKELEMRQNLAIRQKSAITHAAAEGMHQVAITQAAAEVASAQAKLASAEAQSYSRMGANALQLSQLRNRNFDDRLSMLDRFARMEDAAENRALRREQMEATREQRALMAQERIERAKAKQEKDAVIAQYDATLAQFSKMMGYVNPLTVSALERMPKNKAEPFWSVAISGNLGNNVGEALALVNNVGGIEQLRATNKGAALFLEGAEAYVSTVASQAQRADKNIKPAEAVAKAVDTIQTEWRNSATGTGGGNLLASAWGGEGGRPNPYRVPHTAMLGDPQVSERLKDNSLAKNIRVLVGNDSRQLSYVNLDPALEAQALAAVMTSMGPEDASKAITEYYKVGADYQLQFTQYNLFGVQPINKYAVKMPGKGMFGDAIAFNAYDPASVKNAAAKLQRQTISQGAALPSLRAFAVSPLAAALEGGIQEVIRRTAD